MSGKSAAWFPRVLGGGKMEPTSHAGLGAAGHKSLDETMTIEDPVTQRPEDALERMTETQLFSAVKSKDWEIGKARGQLEELIAERAAYRSEIDRRVNELK